MRTISFLSAIAAAVVMAGSVQAQPADVTVTIGPDLDRKARELGQGEVTRQAQELERRLVTALAGHGSLDGARIHLVLTDVTPNRPTQEQMRRTPGLSHFHSFSIGGAAIEGEITTADGQVRPVRYDWYSSNIRDSRYNTTWQDTDRAFLNFSRRLADGRL